MHPGHSRSAQFSSKFFFQVPEKDYSFRTCPVDKDILVRWGQKSFSENLYLLGESKIRKQDIDELIGSARGIAFKWIDILGAAIVLFTVPYAAVHGIMLLLR